MKLWTFTLAILCLCFTSVKAERSLQSAHERKDVKASEMLVEDTAATLLSSRDGRRHRRRHHHDDGGDPTPDPRYTYQIQYHQGELQGEIQVPLQFQWEIQFQRNYPHRKFELRSFQLVG